MSPHSVPKCSSCSIGHQDPLPPLNDPDLASPHQAQPCLQSAIQLCPFPAAWSVAPPVPTSLPATHAASAASPCGTTLGYSKYCYASSRVDLHPSGLHFECVDHRKLIAR